MAESPHPDASTRSSPGSTTSRASILHAFEQLLDQCDTADLPELVKLANIKLAQRGTIHNSQHSHLVKLPAELVVAIGKLVLDLDTEEIHDKAWFAEVLPLMQTCKELRTTLRSLRSTSLTCVMKLRSSRSRWDQVFERLRAWDWNDYGAHEGPLAILICLPLASEIQHPSTTAAMAGALECAIYGGLRKTPCVYMQCLQFFAVSETAKSCITYFVGPGQEGNVVEQIASMDSSARRRKSVINKLLDDEAGAHIWQETIKEHENGY